MNENKQLLVSVAIITYNHAPFIRQALDSVLVQQTDFIFEIVIGEDRSMDGTREIVEDYWKKYPDRINIVTAENNVGANRNVIRTLKACKGKYIALLEGDDYWSDPMKLQKQIDFFEANPNYGLCFTDCILVDSQNKLIKNGRVPEEIKNKKLDYFDLLYYTPPTLTTMFRNSKLIIDEVEKTGKAYDHILFYIASKKKEVHFISTIAGVHRLNSSSIYNPLTSVNKILDFSIPNLRVLEKLTERGDKNEKKALAHGYAIAYSRLLLYSFDEQKFYLMLNSFFKIVKYDFKSKQLQLPNTMFRLAKRIFKRVIKFI